MNYKFFLGAIMFFAGWWAAIDNANYFPEAIDPNNKVIFSGTVVLLPHHWVVGFIFIGIGLLLMIFEAFRRNGK